MVSSLELWPTPQPISKGFLPIGEGLGEGNKKIGINPQPVPYTDVEGSFSS